MGGDPIERVKEGVHTVQHTLQMMMGSGMKLHHNKNKVLLACLLGALCIVSCTTIAEAVTCESFTDPQSCNGQITDAGPCAFTEGRCINVNVNVGGLEGGDMMFPTSTDFPMGPDNTMPEDWDIDDWFGADGATEGLDQAWFGNPDLYDIIDFNAKDGKPKMRKEKVKLLLDAFKVLRKSVHCTSDDPDSAGCKLRALKDIPMPKLHKVRDFTKSTEGHDGIWFGETPEDSGFAPLPNFKSDLKVQSCDSNHITGTQRQRLEDKGFTKCVFLSLEQDVFLVTGTALYPEAYLLQAANILANLLDRDQDGRADDPNVAQILKLPDGPIIQGGVNQQEEQKGDELEGNGGFGYAYSAQTWKVQDRYSDDDDNGLAARSVLLEEVFHMWSTALGMAYPNEFGQDDFQSTMCAEMASQSCVTWKHPENICPDGFPAAQPAQVPLQGTCETADCDCTEWFHQVALLHAGMEPAWRGFSEGFKDNMKTALGEAFGDLMADPKYHQLTKPLSFSYETKPHGSFSDPFSTEGVFGNESALGNADPFGP